jgi:glutathione S-transferase
MWRIYGFPLCAFTRKIRLALAEKRIGFELVDAFPWEPTPAFLALSPAGLTPVVTTVDGLTPLADSGAILEYFEETQPQAPLMGSGPAERAEVRRLVAWFDQKFYGEVGLPYLQERMWHRLYSAQAPDAAVLRQAYQGSLKHLAYLQRLLEERRWLAGVALTMADLAAAAHLSVVDYLGGVSWEAYDDVKRWYMAVKSRPSFRPLLGDRMPGLNPPSHYGELDF